MNPKIEILNAGSQRSTDGVTITKTNLSIPAAEYARMSISIGDFVLVGKIGSNIYIAKKPKGIFGGYKAFSQKHSPRLFANCNAEKLGVAPGKYRLGQKVTQPYEGEHKQTITVEWFELIRVTQ